MNEWLFKKNLAFQSIANIFLILPNKSLLMFPLKKSRLQQNFQINPASHYSLNNAPHSSFPGLSHSLILAVLPLLHSLINVIKRRLFQKGDLFILSKWSLNATKSSWEESWKSKTDRRIGDDGSRYWSDVLWRWRKPMKSGYHQQLENVRKLVLSWGL